MRRTVFLALALLVAAGLACAADVTGKWKGAMQGGSGNELTFDLKADGETLAGTVSGLLDRALAIENGKIDGSKVSFSVMSEWQGSPVRLVYKGEVDGDEIRFSMGTEDGAWGTELTAKRVP
jgi:hypothetical protein